MAHYSGDTGLEIPTAAEGDLLVRDADVDFLCEANFLCGSRPGDDGGGGGGGGGPQVSLATKLQCALGFDARTRTSLTVVVVVVVTRGPYARVKSNGPQA